MKNKTDKKIMLNTPTQIFRTRLRLIGLNNGSFVFRELKKKNKSCF
jgi:hypothetical protein